MAQKKYQAIVIGASAGGISALNRVLPVLPGNYPLPLIITQHLHPLQEGHMFALMDEKCALNVKEANEKEIIQPGYAYFAPPDYHLLIEDDQTLSLSKDEKVNYARPSIDVLFESAADVYASGLIGIVLTGANHDGAQGLKRIKQGGGLTIVQEPKTAESPFMPQAALNATDIDYVIPLEKIADLLVRLGVEGVGSIPLLSSAP